MHVQRGHPPTATAPAPQAAVVRTYVVTGGRTRPDHLLSLETVLAAGSGRVGPGRAEEYGQILALCQQRPCSLAELAGRVGRPVSAMKVLVSDLLNDDVLVLPVTQAWTESEDSARPTATVQLLQAVGVALRKQHPSAPSHRKAG